MRDTLSNPTETTTIDRRSLLCRAGMGGAGLLVGNLLAGCGGHDHHGSSGSSSGDTVNEIDVLNFALNLEYLESAYYRAGAGDGQFADRDVSGSGALGEVTGGSAVTFTNYGGYFQEIAFDETEHVGSLRSLIASRGGTPIARPQIDLNAVNVAIRAATGDANFDAFASEVNFLLGAFLLSDVGVTAYVGGSQYLTSTPVKLTAAKLLAVEAYHIGSIRTLIAQADGTAQTFSRNISDARDNLDGPTDDDQGAGVGNDPNGTSFPNISPTDAGGLAYARTTGQVLAIVYNSAVAGTALGGLFPAGVNGNLKTVS